MYFLESIRGKRLLALDDYIYNLKKENKTSTFWTCKDRTCTGACKIFKNGDQMTRQHNHASDPVEVAKLKTDLRIKQNALNTTYSARDIYTNLILKENLNTEQEKKSVYKNINNIRKKQTGMVSLSEVPLHLQFTFNNELFLITENDNFKLFSTENNFQRLKNSQTWIADGTFLSAPSSFTQLYIVYGFVFKKCIPLVYILMKGKSEKEYNDIFRFIYVKLDYYAPHEIIVDCEKAPKNAILTTFKTTSIFHCLTHFSASIYRHIVRNNLSFELGINNQLKKAIMILKTLVFVPDVYLEDEFMKLECLFASFSDLRVSNFFESFKKSFMCPGFRTHILKQEFRHYSRLINALPLTSNHAEAYNNAISRDLNYSKVSLITFVVVLRKRQAFIELEIKNALKYPNAIYSSKKQQNKMEEMVSIAKKYENYKDLDYLTSLGGIYNWNN